MAILTVWCALNHTICGDCVYKSQVQIEMKGGKQRNFQSALSAGTIYPICLLTTARSHLWSHITILRDVVYTNSAVTIFISYSIQLHMLSHRILSIAHKKGNGTEHIPT